MRSVHLSRNTGISVAYCVERIYPIYLIYLLCFGWIRFDILYILFRRKALFGILGISGISFPRTIIAIYRNYL